MDPWQSPNDMDLKANQSFLMSLLLLTIYITGFSGDSVVKYPHANVGDMDLISGSGRYPRKGKGNPLQYSCLGNPMDRGAWWATVHMVKRAGNN